MHAKKGGVRASDSKAHASASSPSQISRAMHRAGQTLSVESTAIGLYTLTFEDKELEKRWQARDKNRQRGIAIRFLTVALIFQICFYLSDTVDFPEYLLSSLSTRVIASIFPVLYLVLITSSTVEPSQKVLFVVNLIYGMPTVALYYIQRPSAGTHYDSLYTVYGLSFFILPKISPLRFSYGFAGTIIFCFLYLYVSLFRLSPRRWLLASTYLLIPVALFSYVSYSSEKSARERWLLKERLRKEKIRLRLQAVDDQAEVLPSVRLSRPVATAATHNHSHQAGSAGFIVGQSAEKGAPNKPESGSSARLHEDGSSGSLENFSEAFSDGRSTEKGVGVGEDRVGRRVSSNIGDNQCNNRSCADVRKSSSESLASMISHSSEPERGSKAAVGKQDEKRPSVSEDDAEGHCINKSSDQPYQPAQRVSAELRRPSSEYEFCYGFDAEYPEDNDGSVPRRTLAKGFLCWAVLSTLGWITSSNLPEPLKLVNASVAWAVFSHAVGATCFLLLVTGKVRWLVFVSLASGVLLWLFSLFSMPDDLLLVTTHSIGYVLFAIMLALMLGVFGGVVYVWSEMVNFIKRMCAQYPQIQDRLKDSRVLEQVLVSHLPRPVRRTRKEGEGWGEAEGRASTLSPSTSLWRQHTQRSSAPPLSEDPLGRRDSGVDADVPRQSKRKGKKKTQHRPAPATKPRQLAQHGCIASAQASQSELSGGAASLDVYQQFVVEDCRRCLQALDAPQAMDGSHSCHREDEFASLAVRRVEKDTSSLTDTGPIEVLSSSEGDGLCLFCRRRGVEFYLPVCGDWAPESNDGNSTESSFTRTPDVPRCSPYAVLYSKHDMMQKYVFILRQALALECESLKRERKLRADTEQEVKELQACVEKLREELRQGHESTQERLRNQAVAAEQRVSELLQQLNRSSHTIKELRKLVPRA